MPSTYAPNPTPFKPDLTRGQPADPSTPAPRHLAVAGVHLVVTQRMADFHVAVAGTEGRVWSAGKSAYEAIGNLVADHPERFGVKEITYPASGRWMQGGRDG